MEKPAASDASVVLIEAVNEQADRSSGRPPS